MPKRKKLKKYKIELTIIGAVGWSVALFFLLAWIFALGIGVGRGFLPGTEDLKNQIKKLQEMVGKKEEYKDITTADQDKDPELAFYDKLNSKKDEAKKTSLPEKKEEAPGEITLYRDPPEKKTTGETEEKAVTEPVKEAVKEKAPEQKEIPAKTEDLKVTQPPVWSPVTVGQQYTVQIASLPEKEKAENLIKSLVDQGYDAYYYMVEVRGKTYYRVRVGRFDDRKGALDYSGTLEKETGYKGFVSKVE